MFYLTEEEDDEQEATEQGEQRTAKGQEETPANCQEECMKDAGQDGHESRDEEITSSGMGLIGGHALGRGVDGQSRGVDTEEREDINSKDEGEMGDRVKEDPGVEEKEMGGLDTKGDDTHIEDIHMENAVDKASCAEVKGGEDLAVECIGSDCNSTEGEEGLVIGSEVQAEGGMGDMDRGCEGVKEGGQGKWEDSEGEGGDCSICCCFGDDGDGGEGILSCLADCLG